ncbi:MAG: 2Fe-2S iron-sulfur cluster-binding protein, partial [Pseudorhodoplanes sp.]
MGARIIMKMVATEALDLAGDVRRLVLRHPRRAVLPRPEAGAHVDIRLPDGRVRHYSLCGDPDDCSQYVIAVKRENEGRGGSRWIHENIVTGSDVHVSAPRNHFALAKTAHRHILIAGGIGITPMLAMAHHLQRRHTPFMLHYCAKRAYRAPLLADVVALCRTDMRGWFSGDPGGVRFDATAVLADVSPETHIYCCGPTRLVDAVRAAAAHLPPSRLHVETFVPAVQGPTRPFDIVIASTGQTFHVPAEHSALSVLHDNGFRIASSCKLGVCGSCECRYRSGVVIHR